MQRLVLSSGVEPYRVEGVNEEEPESPGGPELAPPLEWVPGGPPEEEDPGYIEFPDFVDSIDVVDELKEQGGKLPASVRQWILERDFLRVSVKINLASRRGARGVKEFRMSTRLEGKDPKLTAQVDDVGPKTEWIAPYSGSVDVKVGVGFLGGLIKLLAGGEVPGARGLGRVHLQVGSQGQEGRLWGRPDVGGLGLLRDRGDVP